MPLSRRLATGAVGVAIAFAAAGPAFARPAPPALAAPAAIVVDGRSGAVLYARAADAHEPIASTTKLMTALLTLESARPWQTFVAPGYVPRSTAEVTIGLLRGERMRVGDLLRALLLPSANDAAFDLAVGVAGSEPAFVARMNRRARQLGLTNTHYANPIGLDSPANYSSARDLARLASLLLRDPLFASIVASTRARLDSGERPRTVANRNDLVGRYPFVTGVKTGHTTAAGDVLVASARAGDAAVVSVVLGEATEQRRDLDTVALLRYGLSRFRRVVAVRAGAGLASAAVRYFAGRRVALVAARSVGLTLADGRLTTSVDAPRRLTGPLRAGAVVGTVVVRLDGRAVGRSALVTGTAVAAAGWLRRLTATSGVVPAALACLVLVVAAGLGTVWLRRRRGVEEGCR